MKQKHEARLLEHDADGIHELDNLLPRWWLYGFYLTIVLGVLYMWYYHVYTGPAWNVLWFGEKGAQAELMADIKAEKARLATMPKKASAKIILYTDANALKRGAEIFNGTDNACFTCHREDLGGMVGPNLTDEYWLHGSSVQELVENVKTGFPEYGMLPFGTSNKMSDEDVMKVVSYIISKRGSNPADPKPTDPERDKQVPDYLTAEPKLTPAS